MPVILRRLWRMMLLLLWFVPMTFYGLSTRGRGWDACRTQARKAKVWGAGIARIINLRIQATGKFPEEAGGLVVANHLGVVDIIALAATFPLRFTPKKEIRSWPFLGWFIAISLPIWIDRRSRVAAAANMQEMADTLREGISLAVFPEGTSSDGSQGVLPFKGTTFEAAAQAGCDIIPVAISYDEDEGPLSWHGDMTLLPHVWDLLGRKKICCHLQILDRIPAANRGRKELAALAHAAISAALRQGPAPASPAPNTASNDSREK